jgi:FRG domain
MQRERMRAMTGDTEQEFVSVGAYVEHVTSQFPKTTDPRFYLFRGQRQAYQEGLVPGLARFIPREKLPLNSSKDEYPRDVQIEREMLNQFKMKSLPFLERVPESTLEWMTVAQHHGLPTRLLDWSCNAIASLWFVVDGGPAKDESGNLKDGVVYVLPTQSLGEPPEGDEEVFKIKKFYLYEPPSVTRRVFAQLGYFTVHPYSRKSPHYFALDDQALFPKGVTKLVISHESFETIRDDLDRLGINRFSIYQDLDSLGEQLRWYFMPRRTAKQWVST